MRSLAALSVFVFLAACQTPCPSPQTGPVNTSFRCEDGSLLNVTFTRNPGSARISQEGYVVVDLPERVTGSGYRYNGNGAELRGHSNEARWTRPGAAETVCLETPRN
ncbi:MAG: MliC family protein [Hyphomonadaceae bacterium]|nr:MliC family protein [Hyphomonadaceae bacterium]